MMFLSINRHYQILGETEDGGGYQILDLETETVSEVAKNLVQRSFNSAETWTSKETCARSAIVERLCGSPQTAMTLTFTKAPQIDQVAEKLRALSAAPLKTREEARKAAKDVLTGETRELSGYFVSMSEEQGRLLCWDYAAGGIRAVDPRTISTLIINNVLYTVG